MTYVIKIYGERNSGTIYLKQLLQNNLNEQVIDHILINNTTNYWKHDFPEDMSSIFKDMKVIYVFIVRELWSWLNSFYETQYDLKPKRPFRRFLTEPCEVRPLTKDIRGKIVNEFDQGKTIFEIRYEKIKSYIKFIPDRNCVLVNMTWLQENEESFLNNLKEIFDISLKENFQGVPMHTKINKPIKNRTYNNEQFRGLVNSLMCPEIEKHVNEIDMWVNICAS